MGIICTKPAAKKAPEPTVFEDEESGAAASAHVPPLALPPASFETVMADTDVPRALALLTRGASFPAFFALLAWRISAQLLFSLWLFLFRLVSVVVSGGARRRALRGSSTPPPLRGSSASDEEASRLAPNAD